MPRVRPSLIRRVFRPVMGWGRLKRVVRVPSIFLTVTVRLVVPLLRTDGFTLVTGPREWWVTRLSNRSKNFLIGVRPVFKSLAVFRLTFPTLNLKTPLIFILLIGLTVLRFLGRLLNFIVLILVFQKFQDRITRMVRLFLVVFLWSIFVLTWGIMDSCVQRVLSLSWDLLLLLFLTSQILMVIFLVSIIILLLVPFLLMTPFLFLIMLLLLKIWPVPGCRFTRRVPRGWWNALGLILNSLFVPLLPFVTVLTCRGRPLLTFVPRLIMLMFLSKTVKLRLILPVTTVPLVQRVVLITVWRIPIKRL